MKLSSAAIALALTAGGASAQDSNADMAAILANWGFGATVESNEPQDVAPPPPLPAQPAVPPPAVSEQPAADSNLDSALSMWGFGSEEPPAEATQPLPLPPPQPVQPPSGGSNLDAVLANWDAMNDYGSGSSSTNQPKQPPIEDSITNHAAAGGNGAGGPITTLDSGSSLGLWSFGSAVNWDDVKPSDKDDGWNGHGEEHIQDDGWGGNTAGMPGPVEPKPVMPMKFKNKKAMKKWCRKHKVPEGKCEKGYGHENAMDPDIQKILDQFGNGQSNPWNNDKPDKTEELDKIIETHFGGMSVPNHEPQYQQEQVDAIAENLKKAKMKNTGMKPGTPGTMPPMPPTWGPDQGFPADSEPECIGQSLEAEKAGAKGRKCMGRDEAICRGQWSFGIAPSTEGNSTDYYVQAWHESEGVDWPLFRDFEGAIELCIGSSKKHDDTSYMTVTTEEATYYLVCPGVGKLSKNPKLKIVDKDTVEIVNFLRGSKEKDVMWQISGEGMDMTNPWCLWEEVMHNATKAVDMPWMDEPMWMSSAP